MDTDTIKKLGILEDRVREVGKGYHNTTSLVSITDTKHVAEGEKVELKFDYDLKDMLLLGAVRETPVLLTGRSDSGKTALTTIVNTALFGGEETKIENGQEVVVKPAGFHKIDVDNDLDEDSFMDPDLSKLGKAKLSEVLLPPKWLLTSKGVILDEGNRIDPHIAAKLMRMLDKEKVLKLKAGIEIKLGVPYEAPDGSIQRYFWPTMCINEGAAYTGTSDMDRAARRRATLEIPMDEALPQASDVMNIIEGKDRSNLRLKNGEEHFQDVLDVMYGLDKIKIDPNAMMYLSYLSNMEKCVKRKKGVKGSDFDASYCDKDGCHIKTEKKGMCGAVHGFTEGLIDNLKIVAKGFAGMRALKAVQKAHEYVKNQDADLGRTLQEFSGTKYTGEKLAKAFVSKYIADLKVTSQDVQAAVPFVGYSKLQVAEGWIKKYPDFDGSKWEALKYIASQALKSIDDFVVKFKPELKIMREQAKGKDVKLTEEQEDRLKKHYEKYDPWIKDTLAAFFSEEQKAQDSYRLATDSLLD